MFDINYICEKGNLNEIINIVKIYNINDIPYNKPLTSKPYPIITKKLTLVSISRQVYRKGTDLLLEIIPILYKVFPNMTFLIGGDGPKKSLLDQTVDTFNMSDRVKLLGALSHERVKEVMHEGDIYLNTSLTETFCIAILEAASCGLFVISTDIGGVQEVLPEHMRILVKAKCDDIIKGVIHTAEHMDKINKICGNFYYELKDCYTYHRAAYMTESVYYDAVLKSDKTIKGRIKKILNNGHASSFYNLCIIIVQFIFFHLIHSVFNPEKSIKISKDFDYEKYCKFLEKIEKEESKDNKDNKKQ